MPFGLGFFAVAGAGAGGASSFDLLATTVLSSNAASVTFSSLGSYSAYKHLQVRAVVRSTENGPLTIRLNSDSGSNYAWHRLLGTGSSVLSGGFASQTLISLTNGVSDDTTAGEYSASIIDLLDFSNTNKNSTIRALTGNVGDATGICLTSGLWNNTAAVTSMTFAFDGFNAVSGSRFSLYGIK